MIFRIFQKVVRFFRKERQIWPSHEIEIACEAYAEHRAMQRLLFEIRRNPDMPEKTRELMPLLRFADERYAVTHPNLAFIPLEMTVQKMLQNYSPSPGDDELFQCRP